MSVIQKQCELLYVAEKTQFIHSIEAVMPGNSKHLMTGITSVYPAEEKLESVLLTIEGLVLFHAVYDKEGIHILRAVPPFDSKGFAEGLLEDIRLIFLEPDGTFIESGRLKNKRTICRYKRKDDYVVDIEIDQANWKIVLFDSRFNRQRTVSKPAISQNFSNSIHLQSHGMIEYSLRLKLIRAESLN